jgi:hypothetical protein
MVFHDLKTENPANWNRLDHGLKNERDGQSHDEDSCYGESHTKDTPYGRVLHDLKLKSTIMKLIS